jgi:hypothetical protein
MTVLAALDYGTVPDWIAGIGSVAATMLLLLGWWRESKLRREERRRQAAVIIQQRLLDIERLYDDDPSGQSLTPAGARAQNRHVREIQVQAVMLPRPFAERLETVSAFFGDRAISGFQGDSDRLVAHNSSRHALAVVTAFLHGKPVPAPPTFVTAYADARTQADGILGGSLPAD